MRLRRDRYGREVADVCKVDGCDRPVRALGKCGAHYQAAYRATRREREIVAAGLAGRLTRGAGALGSAATYDEV